ncbi:glutamate racemase [Agrococcus baldri]|uniref:Glutamate racemase n=1 Tax=Agrococcus baldri TaxID=153730 RepID=A0AA87UQD5_9MICO|nr:glutamate racemase [Agrococcus baldri]GEK78871.1 glutamate racemase [Agrococcus baldri]
MQRPIGVFDSGVGGLTVARAIIDQLPAESITYIGDTANGPYGPRAQDEVRHLALDVLDTLVAQGVKMLVIACNTATAAVHDLAVERYERGMGIPVVAVIEPAVRAAVAQSRSGRIGVIATAGTIGSGAYQRAFAEAGVPHIAAAAAPRFVEFVESGVTTGDEVLEAARGYLEPLLAEDPDTLVLGCTHYPLLAGAIGYVAGADVRLVSSAEETAADVYRILSDRGMLAPTTAAPAYEFEATTEAQEPFLRLARRFLGPEVTHVEFHQTGVIHLPGRTD